MWNKPILHIKNAYMYVHEHHVCGNAIRKEKRLWKFFLKYVHFGPKSTHFKFFPKCVIFGTKITHLKVFFYYQDTQRTLKKYIISKLLIVWWYLEKGPPPLIVSSKLYDNQQLGVNIKKQKNKYKLLLIKYSDIVKTRWPKINSPIVF